MYTVNDKGGKTDRKPRPIPYGLRSVYRNLKSGELQKETLKKLYIYVNSASASCRVGCNGFTNLMI
jgi:hypothetical protein